MSLPSQEVLNDIKELISEVTGFKENDENFAICERYCLSHVIHHTYAFVSRTSVKNMINSYVSRFYGHGYFKVSQELNYQVKRFLSNENLFEKNSQYDIQWSLLSLLSSLSSNLTSVKNVPDLLPIDDEENVVDEINWLEYLSNDLPNPYLNSLSSDNDIQDESDESESFENPNKCGSENLSKECQTNDKTVIIFDNRKSFSDDFSSQARLKQFEEFLNRKRLKINVENDIQLRGNISEKFDLLMNQEGLQRKFQLLSEYELMENILYQFQTGERILLHKGLVNPALVSVTQETLSNFLESLQPHFKIIRSFKDFDEEITVAKYPEKRPVQSFMSPKEGHSSFLSTSLNLRRKKIPNVLYIYNVMLRKALEPFQNQVTKIVNNLENYTLIQIERKLKPYFFELTSLFYIHNLASKNWKKDPNWMSSIRILSVLYNAIMNATTSKMSFLYLNLFLHCFQVYLDIIDTWVSYLDLRDPNDEFIVAKSENPEISKDNCAQFEIRNYKAEMEASGIKEVFLLDFIAEKMTQIGQSLEVLRRLNRFVSHDIKEENLSSYNSLIKKINEKVHFLESFRKIKKEPKLQEKKKSIFTMRSPTLLLERDNGGGDCSKILNILEEFKEEEKEECKNKKEEKQSSSDSSCKTFIYSTIKNSFLKTAFEGIGIKGLREKLEKKKKEDDGGDDTLMVVKKQVEGKNAVYPFHKIISEAFHLIFDDRVSDACALVKHIVLVECNLISHLSLLRSVLLFNDAYLIQPFVLAFFTQPVIWGNSYSLSLHLKECLRGIYKNHANALTVSLAKGSLLKCRSVLQAIENITVFYKVDWPLTLIFTEEIMEKYNEIFRAALKLKWAHWALSGLYFPGINKFESPMTGTMRHRLHILRFWLLSALSRINNYFMAQMLPWDLNLEKCKDFEEIIQVHSNFIKKVHYSCLLGEKSPEGRDLIFLGLIPLCMDLWMEDNFIEEEKLSLMENLFEKCQLQLSRLMSSLEKE